MATQNLSNSVGVTNKGADLLDAATSDLASIGTRVDDAVTTLVGQHMVSLSGQAYGKAVADWLADFTIIKNKLGEMSRLLSQTATGLVNNEHNNSQLPSKILTNLRGTNF